MRFPTFPLSSALLSLRLPVQGILLLVLRRLAVLLRQSFHGTPSQAAHVLAPQAAVSHVLRYNSGTSSPLLTFSSRAPSWRREPTRGGGCLRPNHNCEHRSDG